MFKLKEPIILSIETKTKEQCKAAIERAIELAMEQQDRIFCVPCSLSNQELRHILSEINQKECKFYKRDRDSQMVTVCHEVVHEAIFG